MLSSPNVFLRPREQQKRADEAKSKFTHIDGKRQCCLQEVCTWRSCATCLLVNSASMTQDSSSQHYLMLLRLCDFSGSKEFTFGTTAAFPQDQDMLQVTI